MISKRIVQVVLTVLCILSIPACEGGCLKKSSEVKALLSAKLKSGDSRTKIESVLKGAGIQFSYDKYSNRYQSNITDQCGKFESVIVYVYLDNSSKMAKIETLVSYTAP